MVDATLLPSDCDKELYQKICVAAVSQNMPVLTLQRNLLCQTFNIPSHYSSKTKRLLLHRAITEKSLEENTRIKQYVRNCLRESLGLPLRQSEKHADITKKRTPLKQKEKRFQVLNFLVTVDAATKTDIDRKIGMNTRDVLRTNLHYFEQFQIPYDKHFWWRATEQGRQDYFAIVGQERIPQETPKLESQKLALKKMREGAIQERIVQEREKKIREPKIRVRKQKIVQIEKAEKIRQIEHGKAEARKVKEQKMEQKALAQQQAREYMIWRDQIRSNERLEKKEEIQKIEQKKSVEKQVKSKTMKESKVKKKVQISTKKVTVNVKREVAPVKRDVPMTEAHRKYLMRQEQKVAKEAEKEAKRQKEAKLEESFVIEKNIRDNESGIRKYFLYDLNNPVDAEIVRRIEQYNHLSHYAGHQELLCRRILQKRLRYHTKVQKNTDQLLEQKLLQCCKQCGITRNELVRELFCIHFNIKEGFVEVSQTPNPELTQMDLRTLVSAHSSH